MRGMDDLGAEASVSASEDSAALTTDTLRFLLRLFLFSPFESPFLAKSSGTPWGLIRLTSRSSVSSESDRARFFAFATWDVVGSGPSVRGGDDMRIERDRGVRGRWGVKVVLWSFSKDVEE